VKKKEKLVLRGGGLRAGSPRGAAPGLASGELQPPEPLDRTTWFAPAPQLSGRRRVAFDDGPFLGTSLARVNELVFSILFSP
jgi:hypothetical protein